MRWLPFLLFFAGLAAILRIFHIESNDMAPTLMMGDLAIGIPQPTWAFGVLRRGDLVALPATTLGTRNVRRVIGLPGEVVEVAGGRVMLEGAPLPTQFLEHVEYTIDTRRLRFHKFVEDLPGPGGTTVPHQMVVQDAIQLTDRPGIKLGPDEYYVLADQRTGARDSRDYGPIKGEALRRYHFEILAGYEYLLKGMP